MEHYDQFATLTLDDGTKVNIVKVPDSLLEDSKAAATYAARLEQGPLQNILLVSVNTRSGGTFSLHESISESVSAKMLRELAFVPMTFDEIP